MKKSIAVIGLSRFGLSLVEQLNELNVDLIAVDKDKESVKKAVELIPNAFVLDSTDEKALKSAGISNVDHAIVAIGQNDINNLTISIITINNLKNMGLKSIIARADEEDYAEILSLVGATEIISPLHIASEKIANKVAANNVIDYFNIVDNYDVFEIEIGSNFEPLEITNLDSRNKYKMNILLIKRDEKLIIPTKDTILMPKDHIFIFGENRHSSKITAIFSKK